MPHHILPPHVIRGSKGVACVTVPKCDDLSTVWLHAKGRGFAADIPNDITTLWSWTTRGNTILVQGDVISCETGYVAIFRLWRASKPECVHSSSCSPNGAVKSLLEALSSEGCISSGTSVNAWEVFALHEGSTFRAHISAGGPTPWLVADPSLEGMLHMHASIQLLI